MRSSAAGTRSYGAITYPFSGPVDLDQLVVGEDPLAPLGLRDIDPIERAVLDETPPYTPTEEGIAHDKRMSLLGAGLHQLVRYGGYILEADVREAQVPELLGEVRCSPT